MRRAGLAALLLLACGAARAGLSEDADYYLREPFRGRFERAPEGGWRARPAPGRRQAGFADSKGERERRIFVLGGSVAQLHDRDAPTLARALERALPGVSVSVVNAGSSGYDSARDALALGEILGHAPDLVVLMTGVNDSPDLLPPGPLGRACAWAEGRRARLCRSLLARGAALGRLAARVSDPEKVVVRRFEARARSMARAARAAGVPLVLCTLPASMRDMPPPGALPLERPSFFRAWRDYEAGRWEDAARGFEEHLAARPREAFAHYYLARSLERLGRTEAARARYASAWDLSGAAPLGALDEALRRVAEQEGAVLADVEAAFRAASPSGVVGRELMEDDVHWDRAADPLVSAVVVSALARAPERASRLAGPAGWDAAAARSQLERAAKAAAALRPGKERSWTVFRYRVWEPAHLNSLRLFSERELALLETIRLSHPALLAGSTRLKGWLRERLSDNAWDASAASRLDEWWPVLVAHVGELYRRAGRHREAAAAFEEALRLRPDLDKARLHKALCHWALGQTEAGDAEVRRLYRPREDPEVALRLAERGGAPAARDGGGAQGSAARALEGEGDRLLGAPAGAPEKESPFLALDRARAALSRGDLAEAEKGLAAWVAARPDDAGGRMLRCVTLERLGRFADAVEECGATVRLRPERVDVLLDALCARASSSLALGRRAEAAGDWRRALAAAPRDWGRRAEIERLLGEAKR